MKKEEAKKILIKDIVAALVSWVAFGLVMCLLTGQFHFGLIFSGFIFAGVPLGWRWLSNIVTATSIFMIIIKGIASVFLGWIAIFVIVKDVIAYVNAEK